MKAKILFALTALLMLGSVSLNAQENGNSSNSESTTQLEGDLNHDNKVDVADVTYLVNIIMNQSTSENIPKKIAIKTDKHKNYLNNLKSKKSKSIKKSSKNNNKDKKNNNKEKSSTAIKEERLQMKKRRSS